MPDTFPTAEYRLVQWRNNNTIANATNVSTFYLPPAGHIWSIIAFGYRPSVAETKIVNFVKVDASANEYALSIPTSMALQPASATFLDPGSILDLLPGESVKVYRDSATAGSTMGIYFQFIEWDLPLYEYVEPQLQRRIRQFGTNLQDRISGGFGTAGGGGGNSTGRGPRSPLTR